MFVMGSFGNFIVPPWAGDPHHNHFPVIQSFVPIQGYRAGIAQDAKSEQRKIKPIA